MERTIWMVTEIILSEHGTPDEKNHVACYSTRENAIQAVYLYLANDFEDDDLEDNVENILEDPDYPSGNLTIVTHCGDKYNMFDCEYYIEERLLDDEFGA